MAPNGYLHAATVVALADTSSGYGTVASLPEGARGFTTIELKSNFLGTIREGAIACEATLDARRAHHPGLGRPDHGRSHGAGHRPVPSAPSSCRARLRGSSGLKRR